MAFESFVFSFDYDPSLEQILNHYCYFGSSGVLKKSEQVDLEEYKKIGIQVHDLKVNVEETLRKYMDGSIFVALIVNTEPSIVCIYQKNNTRSDKITFQEASEGSQVCVSFKDLLEEIAFKIGKRPKYGA